MIASLFQRHRRNPETAQDVPVFALFKALSIKNLSEVRLLIRRAMHDLSAPVRHIAVFSQFVEAALDEPVDLVDAKNSIATVRKSATQMQTLMHRLSSFLRLPDQSEPFQECFVQEMALSVWEMLREKIGSDDPHAPTDFTGNGRSGELTIHGELQLQTDLNLLETILAELLCNCIVFADANRPLRVDLELRDVDSLVEIVIRDSGIGMPISLVDQAFEPFGTLGTGSDRRPGVGMGLPIARHCAELLGGEIDIQPNEDFGIQVTLRLPRS